LIKITPDKSERVGNELKEGKNGFNPEKGNVLIVERVLSPIFLKWRKKSGTVTSKSVVLRITLLWLTLHEIGIQWRRFPERESNCRFWRGWRHFSILEKRRHCGYIG
jgi:hypothetical protein